MAERLRGIYLWYLQFRTDFFEKIYWLIDEIKKGVDQADSLLSFNEIFLNRTRNIGLINAEDAIDYGLTGPNLRASGVSYDLRKNDPYSIYERFDFDIPVGDRGDVWDRYFVRVQEIRESVKMMLLKKGLMEYIDFFFSNTIALLPNNQRFIFSSSVNLLLR